jgi:hypothetical protein
LASSSAFSSAQPVFWHFPVDTRRFDRFLVVLSVTTFVNRLFSGQPREIASWSTIVSMPFLLIHNSIGFFGLLNGLLLFAMISDGGHILFSLFQGLFQSGREATPRVIICCSARRHFPALLHFKQLDDRTASGLRCTSPTRRRINLDLDLSTIRAAPKLTDAAARSDRAIA